MLTLRNGWRRTTLAVTAAKKSSRIVIHGNSHFTTILYRISKVPDFRIGHKREEYGQRCSGSVRSRLRKRGQVVKREVFGKMRGIVSVDAHGPVVRGSNPHFEESLLTQEDSACVPRQWRQQHKGPAIRRPGPQPADPSDPRLWPQSSHPR